MLTRQIWEDLFLKGTKIICLVKQDVKLWSKNTKLNLSMIASVSFSNKLIVEDWNNRTLNTDILNLDENKFVYKMDYRARKRFSEIFNSEVCTNWEEWKDLKNYELVKSQCKKIWGKINDSGEFQIAVGDCLTFPVSLKWLQVHVLCWAATNACLLTHGIHRDYRETFLVINVPRLMHSEIILKEFNLAHHKESENQFHRPQGWRLFSQEMTKQSRDTIPMPTFARRPSTVSSIIHVEFPHNCMVGQQRANFGIAIRQIP